MSRSRLIFALVAACLLFLVAVPVLSVQVQAASHNPSRWHAPGFGHEHGDAPPVWLVAAYQAHPEWAPYWGTGVLYDGAFNTSAAENSVKHAGMKGFRLRSPAFKDQDGEPLDGYLVMHLLSNPMDRGAQFHSARMYIKDAEDGLTIRQGWLNTGSVTTARVPVRCSLTTGGPDCGQYDAQQRPVVFVVDQASLDGTYTSQPIVREQWYLIGIGFNFAWGVNATTIVTPGETASDTDPHQWHTTGASGQVREVEVTAKKPTLTGLFFTNQHGAYVANAEGPECQGANICLLQYVSPTYAGITGRMQRTFPLPSDIVLPN